MRSFDYYGGRPEGSFFDIYLPKGRGGYRNSASNGIQFDGVGSKIKPTGASESQTFDKISRGRFFDF